LRVNRPGGALGVRYLDRLWSERPGGGEGTALLRQLAAAASGPGRVSALRWRARDGLQDWYARRSLLDSYSRMGLAALPSVRASCREGKVHMGVAAESVRWVWEAEDVDWLRMPSAIG
jgi:hypothetical protein